ncbi:hypothetical protein [Haloferax sp. YSSS75]
MYPIGALIGEFVTFAMFLLMLFLPIGAYIWLRSRGILGEPPGRGLQ